MTLDGGGRNPSYANQVRAVYVSPVTDVKNRGWEKCWNRLKVKEKVFGGVRRESSLTWGLEREGRCGQGMCHDYVVLDTPKHHGMQAKQQNHLDSVRNSVHKS